MRYATLIFIPILILLSSAGPQSSKMMAWEAERKLTWRDFKGRPNMLSSHAALSNCGTALSMRIEGTKLLLQIESLFDPSKSWVKKSSRDNEELLAHEQLHFDIQEWHCRKLRKTLTEVPWRTTTEYFDVVEIAHERVIAEIEEVQSRYDEETEHSLVKEAQQQWEVRVSFALDSLDDYSSPKLEFEL